MRFDALIKLILNLLRFINAYLQIFRSAYILKQFLTVHAISPLY